MRVPARWRMAPIREPERTQEWGPGSGLAAGDRGQDLDFVRRGDGRVDTRTIDLVAVDEQRDETVHLPRGVEDLLGKAGKLLADGLDALAHGRALDLDVGLALGRA